MGGINPDVQGLGGAIRGSLECRASVQVVTTVHPGSRVKAVTRSSAQGQPAAMRKVVRRPERTNTRRCAKACSASRLGSARASSPSRHSPFIHQQVAGDQDKDEPGGIDGEAGRGQVGESGVLGVADPALAAPPAPIEGVEEADVVFWVVGDEDLVAVALDIAEGELGAWVGLLAPDDHPGALPQCDKIHQVGDLGHLSCAHARRSHRPRWLLCQRFFGIGHQAAPARH